MTLNDFKDKHCRIKRTKKCDELEEGYEKFKHGTFLHGAPIEKGMTPVQQRLLPLLYIFPKAPAFINQKIPKNLWWAITRYHERS